MMFEISDFWIGFLFGIVVLFAIVIIVGLLTQPKKEEVDKFHPLNKKE